MRNLARFKAIPAIMLGIVMGVGITPAFAVDGVQPNVSLPNLFELDGNPYQDTGSPIPPPPEGSWFTPHDWDSLYLWCDSEGNCPEISGVSVPYEFTGIIWDPAPKTIFTTGGSKDVYDISSWKWKDGAVPDKDDIIDAYAAAYINPEDICYDNDGLVVACNGAEPMHYEGDLIIDFGLDRFDNSGDAFAGFWFLQNNVGLDDVDMDFTVPSLGEDEDLHVGKRPALDEWGNPILDGLGNPIILRGDILVLVEYPQGSGEVPVIKAYEYDPLELGDPNVDEDGKSIGPLEMIYDSANEDSSAECDGYGGKLACAITNKEDLIEPAEWGEDQYLSKDGTTWFPYETFYEGGINLTQLLGGQNICVHTFLAETRSSRSETAQLKDFVRGSFELCGSKIRTEVHDPSHNDVTMWNPMDYEKVMAGTALHDFAEVEIIVPGVKMDPVGEVEFRLFEDLNCTIPALDESDEPLVWTFEIDQGADPMGNGELDDYLGWAETPSMVLPAAEDYSFSAKFLSDAPQYFPNVTAACEPFGIAKYPSGITTEIHAGTDHATNLDANAGGSGRVDLGTTLHDHAYVSGAGPAFQGTVTFYIFKNGNCSDDEAWDNGYQNDFEGTFGGATWPKTYSIGDDGTYVTDDFTPMQFENITFSIKAKFNGDSNYLASEPSACEVLTADLLKANVVTMVKVRDLAKVTDDKTGNPIDDGNVIFQAYKSAACTSGTELGDPVEVALGSNGMASEAVDDEIMLYLDPNTVSYRAIYDGGSGLYEQTQANCERVVFDYPM
jgi:hypothetical protein